MLYFLSNLLNSITIYVRVEYSKAKLFIISNNSMYNKRLYIEIYCFNCHAPFNFRFPVQHEV